MTSTPTPARDWLRGLFARKRAEPSYPRLPRVGSNSESSVRGIYLLGDVGGTPLIKLGLNEGVEVLEGIQAELGSAAVDDPDLLDVLIVGAGASGLAAAMRAHELGLRYRVLESERIAMSVVNMYKGKLLFAEPEGQPNRSGMWFEECTREELLARWRAQVEETGLAVNEHEKVEDIRRRGDELLVTSTRGQYRARRVLLCIGKAGNPRKAGVPGEQEHSQKLLHSLSDPSLYQGRRIFIYGGGDVAAEAALALNRANDVTMVTADSALTFPKKRNVDALESETAAGRLALHLSSKLIRFDADHVVWQDADGKQHTTPNDVVFEMIGAELPVPFFRRLGIKLEGDWSAARWLYLAATSLFVYTLYALKKFPETPYSWPFNRLLPEDGFHTTLRVMFSVAFTPFRWLFDGAAYEQILATPWFQQGYLYSLIYTILMVAFGRMAFKRWSNIARDNRYQKWRFISLVTFQVVFFLAANVIAIQAMSIQHAWRVWGLYQPWPLFFNTFHGFESSDPRLVLYTFVAAGLLGTFVAIPWASHKHGKRFCTWICGCGGLAETLGDRWRHLSPKGARSRAWEFQGAVLFVAAALATLVTVGIYHSKAGNAWALAYSYVVDFWLVAVIPVALYPFFGGKVWCRYWCPLAAWNQVLAAWYGRLRIKANEKCISCTMCSRYCQVGVDVMSFAKNQESFDNRNSACIHCGICIDVCPMDVLSFDTSREGSPSLPVVASGAG